MLKLLLFSSTLALSLIACSGDDSYRETVEAEAPAFNANAPEDLQILKADTLRTIHQGNLLASGELIGGTAFTQVIHSQENYEQQLAAFSNDIAEMINFETSQILQVFGGQQINNGYSIQLDAASSYIENERIYIVIDRYSPKEPSPSSCLYTQALVYPYLFIQVQSQLEISIEYIEKESTCVEA